MAELAAKNGRIAAEERLLLSLEHLTTVVDAEAAGGRTVASLSRHLTAARNKWTAYDQAHFSYMEKIKEEDDKVAERAAYKAQDTAASQLFERAEVVLDGLKETAAAAVAPQVDNNLLFTITEVEQGNLYDEAKTELDSVKACLAIEVDAEGAVKTKQELEVLSNEVDGALEQMAAAALITKQMIKLQPAQAVQILASEVEKMKELKQAATNARRVIGARLSSAAEPERSRSNSIISDGGSRGRGINDTYQYKRREKPTFDGQKRNYPSWKREWEEGISGLMPENCEVREVKLHVPVEVEPDLKNLTSMKEVWAILDSRYGKAMELTQELISGLQCFTFSKQATNSSSKFMELYREFVKVYNDLQQIGSLSVLDHDPTLCTLAKQLPSADSKMRYTQLRLARLDENEKKKEIAAAGRIPPVGLVSNLDIINEFMRKEREIQVNYEQLLPEGSEKPRSEGRPAERGFKREQRCFKCDKPGHREKDCREGARRGANSCYKCNTSDHKADDCDDEEEWDGNIEEEWDGRSSSRGYASHANIKEKPKDCPACKGQHTFTGNDGQPRYKCRLAACDTFKQMSVNERASLMERINGCVLCTDWTGSHTREHCEEETRSGFKFGVCRMLLAAGGECGKRHHQYLHGNTSFSKFCNTLSVNVISKNGQRAPPTKQKGHGVETDVIVKKARRRSKKQRGVKVEKMSVLVEKEDEDIFEDALDEIYTEEAKAESQVVQAKVSVATFLEQALQVGGVKFQAKVGQMLAKVEEQKAFMERAVEVGGLKFKEEIEEALLKQEKREAKVLKRQTAGAHVGSVSNAEIVKPRRWPFSKLKSSKGGDVSKVASKGEEVIVNPLQVVAGDSQGRRLKGAGARRPSCAGDRLGSYGESRRGQRFSQPGSDTDIKVNWRKRS